MITLKMHMGMVVMVVFFQAFGFAHAIFRIAFEVGDAVDHAFFFKRLQGSVQCDPVYAVKLTFNLTLVEGMLC